MYKIYKNIWLIYVNIYRYYFYLKYELSKIYSNEMRKHANLILLKLLIVEIRTS